MAELTKFFKPGSVAIIGASATPGKIGYAIVKNLIDCGYAGKIFPVNPRGGEIEGLPCYPSLAAIGEPVDLAVVSVPAQGVLSVAEDCGQAGIGRLVVVTAGFKEVGTQGLELEKELAGVCEQYGMQMLGPNCVGLMDTHTPINASFSGSFPAQGDIAFLSQSGAMLIAILDWSTSVGLGFSKVISLGNKACLSEIDFIEAAAACPDTRVILCYIEDIADGPRFLQVAAEAARKKPVIILKSGTSQAGAQAASSHTGALAGSDLAYDTAFRQCGIIRARSMAELFDLAMAFSKSPVPRGENVAIITNSGGPGIITTDNVELKGLKMARFSKETIEFLRSGLPAEAGIYNPVDVLGDARADRYQLALDKVCADPNVDSVIVLMCPAAVTQPLETTRAIIAARDAHPEKPILAAYLGGESLAEGARVLSREGVPCFTFPEPAVAAISGLVEYGRYRDMPPAELANGVSGLEPKAVKAVFYDVVKDHRLVLLGSEAAEVARAYGIPAAPAVLTTSPEEAVAEAEKMGYPVVLKVASPKILHKTDVGGVKIGLQNAAEVRQGFVDIMNNIQRYFTSMTVHGIEVYKMMPQGTELIVGMTRDIQFGPLVAFGLGGIYVNLLKDVSFRLAQGLTLKEIESMVAETKASVLLRGYRGQEPGDMGAVVEVIRRVAKLVTDFPEITELDINPLFAYQQGVSALDVKITIS